MDFPDEKEFIKEKLENYRALYSINKKTLGHLKEIEK